MFGLGPWEIGLIFVAILLVLGPTRLPEVARSLAKGVKEFRKASQEPDDEPAPPPAVASESTANPTEPAPAAARAETAQTSSGS